MHYKKTTIGVHVLVARAFVPNPENKPVVDHINGDRSDNRIQNLRWVTVTENAHNRKKREGISSSYKGVSWYKKNKRWYVQIMINRKPKYLGQFDDEEEAAHAYDDAARKYFGEFAKLNFPDDGKE